MRMILKNTNTSEIEQGAAAFQCGYHGGWSSLPQKVSHHLAARIPLKKIPMHLKKPILTVTFDDVSTSAIEVGAEILQSYNAQGTFYITTDLMGRHISGSLKANENDIRQLYSKNHEIGLHSHSHLPIFSYSKMSLMADLEENKSRLLEILPNYEILNYCYPYGVSSLQHKYWLSSHVRSARVLWNSINKGTVDPYFLKGQLIDSDCSNNDDVDKLLQDAKKNNGWLVTISHQVGNSNKLSTPPETLKNLLKKAIDLDFDIVTINQGLDKIQKLNRIER